MLVLATIGAEVEVQKTPEVVGPLVGFSLEYGGHDEHCHNKANQKGDSPALRNRPRRPGIPSNACRDRRRGFAAIPDDAHIRALRGLVEGSHLVERTSVTVHLFSVVFLGGEANEFKQNRQMP